MAEKTIMQSKERIIYYDLIKIFSIFMVCFYHLDMLDMGYYKNSIYVPNLNKMIMNFCAMSIPLFFIINGALLLRKTYSIKDIFNRFFKIIFLYCVWTIILSFINSILFKQQFNKNIVQLIVGGSKYTVHLWFLKTIAILTLLVPFLKKIYDSKFKKISYLLMIFLFIFPFLYNYIVLIGRCFYIPKFENINRTGLFTMYSILYFILGKILSDKVNFNNKLENKFKILAILSIFIGWMFVTMEVILWTNMENQLFDGVNSSFPTIGALLMAIGVFCLFSQINLNRNNKLKKIIKLISDNFLGIYIFHPTLVNLFKSFINTNISLGISIVIAICIIYVTTYITIFLKKIPIIKHLLSI